MPTEAIDIVLHRDIPEPKDMTRDRAWGLVLMRGTRLVKNITPRSRLMTVSEALAAAERECESRGVPRA